MKPNHLIKIAVFCLLVGLPMGLLLKAHAQDSSTSKLRAPISSIDYRISGPYTYKNLTVFLVHGKDLIAGKTFLTLQEALAQKKVIVYETKEVNELAIKNLSTQDVYVQAGDIVRGGEQDRMMSMDFIVPPKSGRIPIAAFCVESGRWSKRGTEQAGSFSSSENSVSTKELKLAAKRSNSQSAVWENVSVAQTKLSKNVGASVNSSISSSSLELSVGNAKVQESAGSYINALSDILQRTSDVIGYAFAINGEVNSADVYASRALFAKLWPKLLKASAVEAIAELQKDQRPQSVTKEKILAFLANSEKGFAKEKDVTARVRLLTREDERSIFFETRDRHQKDAWIHRNYIRK